MLRYAFLGGTSLNLKNHMLLKLLHAEGFNTVVSEMEPAEFEAFKLEMCQRSTGTLLFPACVYPILEVLGAHIDVCHNPTISLSHRRPSDEARLWGDANTFWPRADFSRAVKAPRCKQCQCRTGTGALRCHLLTGTIPNL